MHGSCGVCHHSGQVKLVSFQSQPCGKNIDGDTVWVSILIMTSITSKELHEKTGDVLDRVKQGQRFRVLRGGEADAFLVPATEQVDPSWDEIMTEVRKARAEGKPSRPNPILAERRKRNYAARVRR
jgi:antitoxin (DNA-binding transcriptional repressor) of toxin-antitoxin stability system